ncbi:MAG: hypothetical protein EPN33_04920 [Acidobacteria bacterium]|nr:MAG: hypothetical protein EPN33_04920 [Acidobacteriota bacterium]
MPVPAESESKPATAAPRNFELPADAVGLPLPPRAQPRERPQPRDLWLRVTTFAVLLGAVLTILYAWFLAQPDALNALPPAGLASFEHVLVPLLAVMTVVGVFVLDRVAVLGVILMLSGTAAGLAGGAIWLVPGTVLGCIWAVQRQSAARAAVGFLLLVPGVAAVFYGLLGALAFLSGQPFRASALGAIPLSLGQALLPLEWLPLALLGAWLLVRPLAHERS